MGMLNYHKVLFCMRQPSKRDSTHAAVLLLQSYMPTTPARQGLYRVPIPGGSFASGALPRASVPPIAGR